MRGSINTLALVGLVTAFQSPVSSTDYGNQKQGDTITRDVCIIGGGSGGTYTSIRLRQLGQSVVVIEKEALMGGQTNTYIVPGSGLAIDYGVVVFHNTSIVRNYFEHLKVAMASTGSGGPTSPTYVDFRTGRIVQGYSPPDPTAALKTWVDQLKRYPFLSAGGTGFILPDPVPKDLLLVFKDFVKMYELGGLVQLISSLGQGYADLLEQPTLYAMKLLSLDLVRSVQTGFVATAADDNHIIYDAAAAELTAANSLLLSSHVISVIRNYDAEGWAKVVVQTPSGQKIIKAKKIVVAFPPRTSNFEGWDLDDSEKEVFGTYINEAYYTGLISNTGLPEGDTISNIGANTQYNLPALPGMYGFSPTLEPGLIDVKYASPFEQDNEVVQSNILTALGNLKIPKVTTTPEKVKWKAFKAHVPFFEHVTAEQIKYGFYKRAMALQGHRRTWYTGAAWETQDSSMIWNFTETLLPAIVKV